MRGRNGNPAANFALQPRPNQDVLSELREKLNLILNKEVNIEPKFIEKVDLGATWHTTFEYEYLGQRIWVRDSPRLPFFVSIASTFEECHNIELVQCPADIGLQEQAVIFAHSYFKGEAVAVPLWDLRELKHEWLARRVYLFTIPNGYITLSETNEKGHWVAADKNELNIKRSGNYQFLGDDPLSIALKAYNWHLSELNGDYFSEHPFVGKYAFGRSLGTGEEVQGTITLVNPDGEAISHVVIATEESEYTCDRWQLTCDRWELIEISNQQQKEQIIMATVIPADKFDNDSVYSFILRENPEKRGIEIHFPPECKTDSANAIAFIAKIIGAGFKQANKNPKLYYATYSEALIARARSWTASCKTLGAYELGSNEPVERTPSRRRYPPKEPVAASTHPAHPPTPNKLLDAIASLLNSKVDPLAENIAACIMDRLKSELRDSQELDNLKAENLRLTAERDALVKDSVGLTQLLEEEREQMNRIQKSYCQLESIANSQATFIQDYKAQLAHSEDTIAQLQLECEQMRSQLLEFGLEPESAPSAPTFDDEPVFADESLEEIAPTFADESIPQPKFDDEEEESGFDLDELDGGK
ncbi:MAG: hypothetical protein HWQ38_19040 [Nostoc sp. NMS7]|uniref:hypothetical protein n=1 Tax=Nostoc sp. NMS7 TaxID=2815391 RepID=UPI0025ECD618|nr:hypothetical protein [Nostoc sp. NMS7]MBN3948433.1 hypothetical protein [Nostoc sp. NMS7]